LSYINYFMKYLRIKLLVLLLCLVATSFADDFPWKKYGLNPKVLTLSKGKYKEFHDMETVVQIGSVYFNTETRKIVGFVKKDTTSKVLSMDAHTVSRWFSPDPLSEEYSSWSPYNYVMNNPVIFIDPDGRSVDWYLNLAQGKIEYRPGSDSHFDEALVHLADDKATVGEVENSLKGKNYKYKKDASVSGGYRVDTEKQFKGWKMMQIFSPENVGTVLAMSINGTQTRNKLSSKITASSTSTVESTFSINPKKFDYFFGKVTTGSPHNVARSSQNLKDLTTLGIKNKGQLMGVFKNAINNGKVISTKTNNYGTTVTRSANIGNKGSVNVGFFYKGGNLKSVPSVTTIIPKIY